MEIGSIDWGRYLPSLWSGALTTLRYTAAGFLGATAIGLVIALARISRIRALRTFARTYTEVFRNLPLITELFIVYFGLASLGLVFSAFKAGAVSLAIFYGAYLSEIFRAAIQGVDDAQREAGLALGLTPSRIFWSVTLPQAVRLALPGTSTMLVDLLKGTSLMVTIGGAELMTEAAIIVSSTFRAMEVYLVIGAIYVALSWPLSQLSVRLEKHLRTGRPLLRSRKRNLSAVRAAISARSGA